MKLSGALRTLLEFKKHALDVFLALGNHADPDVALSITDLVEEEREILAGIKTCIDRHGTGTPEANKETLDGLLSMEYFRGHASQTGLTDRNAALDLAIQFEKDALLLFTEIWTLCPGEECQSALQELITMEKKHLLRLLDLRKQTGVNQQNL